VVVKVRRGFTLAGLVVMTAACMAPPPTPSGPAFPGWPTLTPGPGETPCLTVLLVGDSLMRETAPYVPDYLAGSGRCTTVINAAVNGTGPGRDWPDQLPGLLTQYHPQVVVAEFIGNTPEWPDAPWGSPLYNERQQQGSVQMIQQAKTAGAQIFWSIPPACCIVHDQSKGWADYRTWVIETDLGVPKADWDHFITPTGVYSEYLTFPDGVQQVRAADCAHLNDLGGQIAGAVTAASIQGEWPAGSGGTVSNREVRAPAAVLSGAGP
jgi:hypothetical protein